MFLLDARSEIRFNPDRSLTLSTAILPITLQQFFSVILQRILSFVILSTALEKLNQPSLLEDLIKQALEPKKTGDSELNRISEISGELLS